ncbi:hypothetical protein V1512DRAFT_264786 [Lipomyces arxii]|uniref:uncharacterized protein n=1 Tax=Lipomyces arxii TaxID=56418 RepID=UPI0034CD73CF
MSDEDALERAELGTTDAIVADDEDELSELDEEQFKDIEVDNIGLPITEEVFKIQRHKRSTNGVEKEPKKKRERTRTVRRSREEEGDGNGEGRPQERRRKSSGSRRTDEKPEEIDLEKLTPEERRLRELQMRIDAVLKPQKKRKKADEDDLEAMQDEMIAGLRERMRQAAIRDAEAIKEGMPAAHKLQMLPEVREVLQKQSLYSSILENNLLESVRIWLEPLPDASLPSYSIQRDLFKALEELPIKTDHLRESGIGKIVLFYQKSKRPQVAIKQIADKLVGNWGRPIMGRKKR